MKTASIIISLAVVFGAVLYLQNKSAAPVLTSPTTTAPSVTKTPIGTSSPTSSPMCDFAAPPTGCHYENINQTPCHADLVCIQSVSISGFQFAPGSMVVKTGTKVTWQNNDNVPHNIVASDNSFHSPNLNKGDKFEFIFTQPGQFDYICGIHPSMHGKVIVR